MKFCFKCKVQKSLLEFFNDKSRTDGKYPTCKTCVKKYQDTENFRNSNKIACSKWGKSLKGSISKNKYKKTTKGKSAEKRYRKNNKGVVNARTARRRAKKLQATPLWLTSQHISQIKEIYKNCTKGFEVDHIVPLQGKNVRGLHVPWNLQILPLSSNRSKGNRLKGI